MAGYKKSAAAASKGNGSISGYLFTVAIAAVTLLLVTVGCALWLGQRAREARSQQAANHTADLLEASLAEQTASLQQALNGIADLKALHRALRSNDQPALTDLAGLLWPAFPRAARLMIVPPGKLSANPQASPPIGYALLDMVKAAAEGHHPLPEIHLPGRPNANVNLVAPVREGTTNLGTLVLTYTAERFFQGLRPPADAWIGLQGNTAGDSDVLVERGNHRAGGTRIQLAVSGTPWQLVYIDGHSAGLLTGLNVWLVIGLLAIPALLIGLAAATAGARLRRALAGDMQIFADIARDAQAGTLQTEYPLRLRELRAAVSAALAVVSEPAEDRPEEDATSGEARSEANIRIRADHPAPAHAIPGMEVAEIDATTAGQPDAPTPSQPVDPTILRAYDIRGVVGKTLTDEVARLLGMAIGSEAVSRGLQNIAVGYDGRHSSPQLAAALHEGLAAAGCSVIDIGRVPTPMVYFAAHYLDCHGGVAVTGSHNPPEYNGLKIVLGNETLSGDAIQALGQRIERGDLLHGNGHIERLDVFGAYQEHVLQDIALHRPLKVVVDCGNGVTGEVAPVLMQALGCEVCELFCEVDGDFPNHHPDPSVPANLAALIDQVRSQSADIGLAFDGDGDRLGVVDNHGKIIWADRQLMLFAKDILSRSPGADIVFDVKCSSLLADVITEAAGVPVLWKTGHSLIKSKLREISAPLAGEMSGHLFFNDRWYGFDDGIYAAARLLELLSMDPRESSEVFAELPEGVSTPELRLDLEEGEPQRLINALLEHADFSNARVTTIDGLRVDFPDGWGLVRASNTEPCLVMRFEGNDKAALERIETIFRNLIEPLRPGLALPF